MTNKKKLLTYSVIASLCLTCNGCKNNNKYYNSSNTYVEEKSIDDTKIDTTEQITTEEIFDTTEQITTENSYSSIDSFRKEKEKIKEYIDKQDLKKAKKKGKEFFINCVDFIFYDKEINGKTFNDLTEEEKEEMFNIFCTVDEWIVKISPDYKDNLSDKYSKVKSFTKEKYYTILSKIKEKISEEKYNDIKEKKDDIKESVGNGLDSVKKKIKNKYEDFKSK